MKILFVIHTDFEQPSVIASWAVEKGFKACFSRPFAGEILPKAEDFDWLILMGGPQSRMQIDRFP